MNKPKNQPVSLRELNQKLDIEARRIVREKEESIVKYISKKANMSGNSTMVFRNRDGVEVTLSFRLNKDGNLRFAYENSSSA